MPDLTHGASRHVDAVYSSFDEPKGKDASSATVYAEIREWIVATPPPIGSRIRAADIATKLRVSNTPVREALIRLGTEGLIETRRGSGFFVPIPRVAEAVALFDASQLIIRWSLQRLTADGAVKHLNGRLETEEDRSSRPAAVARRWCLFNRSVIAASGNDVLSTTLSNIDDRLFQLRLIDAKTPETADQQMTLLDGCLSALQAGHNRPAIALLSQHHADLAARVPQLVERRILGDLSEARELSSLALR